MAMKTPPHMGGFVWRQILEPLGLSVSEAAVALGVSRQALSNLLNEHAALSAEMALRIEKAFGPRLEHLMQMQLAYDVAQARSRERSIRVPKFRKAVTPR
jgi:addiction module HigA family antidote